jgi:hypothetical protein
LEAGTAFFVETTGLTQDHPYVGYVIEGWLGRQGLNICDIKEEATHRARVIVQSIGPSQNTKSYFGDPLEALAKFCSDLSCAKFSTN